jgi:hypothetical protein
MDSTGPPADGNARGTEILPTGQRALQNGARSRTMTAMPSGWDRN